MSVLSSRKSPLTDYKFWSIAIGSVVAIAAATFVLCVPAGVPIGETLGYIGVAVSSVGALIAVAIFLQQKIDSNKSASAQTAILGKLMEYAVDTRDRMKALQSAAASSGSDDDQDFGGEDPYADEMAEVERSAEEFTDANGHEVALFNRDDVPLAVIADLVAYWIGHPEPHGRNGRWSVGNLIGGWRRTGKGNHPWFLGFQNTAGERIIWRLGKGGGNGSPGTKAERWLPPVI
jgi:hypothetical protein